MKTKHILLNTFALAIALAGCKKDVPDPEPPSFSLTTYENGVFVTNEGTFGTGTGTLSFYSRSTSKVSNDIFDSQNLYPLGNVVQSMEIYNGKAYIIVNNAGKVEVADGSTFKSKGVIKDLKYPRYFLGVNGSKGYVSQWGNSGAASVKVVNLNTNTVTDSIKTGKGAEGMVMVGNYVYVACSGGYDNDSVVTVIDATADTIVKSINVGTNPKSLKVDTNGKIWVLCNGSTDISYNYIANSGKLVRIDASTGTVDLSIDFPTHPGNLAINGGKTTLYYTTNGKVYSHSVTASTLNSSAIINRNFYGLGIDPTNDYFYGSDAGNYSGNGKVLRYSPTGTVVDSFTVGVIPGNFFFK